MNATERNAIEELVEQTLRATPGVIALYRPGPLAAAKQDRFVTVGLRAGILRIDVALGIDAAAAETCRTALDATAAALSRSGYPGTRIRIVVVHVAGAASPGA